MKEIIFIIVILLVPVFGQNSLKIGVGGGYLPDLSKSRYPFSQKMTVYGSGLTEMEVYWKNFGVSVDAEITTASTSSIFGSIKISNGRWVGARKYSVVFSAGAFNKESQSILVLGLGADIKASWLISGSEIFKNIDVQARVYLPAKMFSNSKISNDVCARVGVYWRFWTL